MKQSDLALSGNAALSICESMLLALLEEQVLDEEEVKELLEDASASHVHRGQAIETQNGAANVGSMINRISQTVLSVNQRRASQQNKPLKKIGLSPSLNHQLQKGDNLMNDNVYSVTELVGSSTKSVEDAINQAISVASETIDNLDWFETTEIRGHIKDGKIAHYQVVLKLGFRYAN